MCTVDRVNGAADRVDHQLVNSSIYANTADYQQSSSNQRETNQIDINYADERMKRYYGIIPKEKPAEIRTVRIVKRESEKRQRDKTKRPFDDFPSPGLDELTEEEANEAMLGEDCIMDDPVLSQFSHILTLPRRNKDDKDKKFHAADLRASNSYSHDSFSDSRSTLSNQDQRKDSINRRRNVSSVCKNLYHSYLMTTFRLSQKTTSCFEYKVSLNRTPAAPTLHAFSIATYVVFIVAVIYFNY